jgi:hypothetical protein
LNPLHFNFNFNLQGMLASEAGGRFSIRELAAAYGSSELCQGVLEIAVSG